MHRFAFLILVGVACCGCPRSGADSGQSADLQSSAPIPDQHPLLEYENLQLGMSNFEVSRAFPAPDGKGKGYTRVIEDYGDVRNQIIGFEVAAGQPSRRIVLRLYRDQLAKLVDRREGLTEEQAREWFESLRQAYGEPDEQTLSGAQWVWGERGGTSLTFTQDNASPESMTANVVLVHEPTYEGSVRYLERRPPAR